MPVFHRHVSAVGIVALLGALGAGRVARGADAWVCPEAERAKPNPVGASAENVKHGSETFAANCAVCHGPQGKGDGPLAGLHATRTSERPRDLSDAALQKRVTDSEMFWKITTGLKRGEQVIMPSFEKAIPVAEDRWKVALFIRSLAQPAK
jgi:mono/diheme cytochrome c family protein